MTTLDCNSPDKALRSLSALLRIDVDRLKNLLLDTWLDSNSPPLQAPYDVRVFNAVRSSFTQVDPPTEVIWFHGTRLARHTSFEAGLLPLSRCIDGLRATVDRLARDLAIPDAAGFVNSSYCSKLQRLDAQGPCASLLREAVVCPVSHRDFLASPEIVEDLAQERAGDRSGEIIAAYQRETDRCVVAFRSREPRADVVRRAMAYCHSHLHRLEDPTFWNTTFDGRGVAVPAEDIVKVEWLAGQQAVEAVGHASS